MSIYLVYLVMDDTLKNQFPYLVNPDTVQYVTDEVEISLYAYTDRKDLAKSFSKCRNKDMFYIKKKKISDEEWKIFKDKFYLYELIPCVLDGIFHAVTISRFEEMICTDIECYKSSIDYVVESRKVNVDQNSVEYLKNEEMIEMISQLYGTYRNPFEIWVRYFAPTIDIARMSKYISS